MTIRSAVYSHLSNAGGVTAIVGASIFPQFVPQGSAFPAIVYSIDAIEVQPLLYGVSSLREALVNVDCYSHSQLTTDALAAAVEAALVGAAHGELGALSPPQMIDAVRLERFLDLFESDTLLYRVSLQFVVAYYP